MHSLLLVDGAQLLFQQGYLVEDYTAVGLYLGLSRTAHAYAASLTLKVSPHACEPGEEILVLGELHLGLCVCRACTFCEYVKDQACAVKDFHFEFTLDVYNLLGGQVVIEYCHAYVVVLDVGTYLIELPFSDVCAGVRVFEFL